LEVLKKAEKSDNLIIRLVETKGALSSCKLNLRTGNRIIETNLLEWVDGQILEGREHDLFLKPFEILTFKID